MAEQIFNGKKVIMESLQMNKSIQILMDKLIRGATKRGDIEIILDTHPDFIIVSLTDRKTQKPRSKNTLPEISIFFNVNTAI